MTTQQTDIEKTLKRILARELTEWPTNAGDALTQSAVDTEIFSDDPKERGFTGIWISIRHAELGYPRVTRAEWEAERALLASEQAQPLGDSEEFDQALWDKVAISFIGGSAADQRATWTERGTKEIVEQASNVADAFMAERAKRIAARKAGHD